MSSRICQAVSSFSLGITVLIMAGAFAPLRAEELPREQFLQDYRKAIKQLQEFVSQVRLKGKLETSFETERYGKTTARKGGSSRFEYVACGGYEKLEMHNELQKAADGPKEKVASTNQRYNSVIINGEDRHFLLRQQYEDAPFFLKDHSFDESVMDSLRMKKALSVNSMFGGAFLRIQDYVNDPSFAVDRVERIDWNGESLIRAEIHWQVAPPANSKFKEPALFNGWILLDPARSLALREFEIQGVRLGATPFSGSESGAIEYFKNAGPPTPKLIKINKRSFPAPGIRGNSHYMFHVEEWSYEPTPTREFTLEAYGVEDPNHPQ